MPTEHDLRRLEGELRRSLPEHYRRFLLSFPAELRETKLDLGWCQEAISDRKLRDAVDQLIDLNKDVRRPGTPWTEDEGPWPDQYFVIGDDQCGNYWALDAADQGETVYFYDHDTGKFDRQHDSLAAFARSLIAETNKWNQAQGKR